MKSKGAAFLPMGVGVGVAVGVAIGAATGDMGLWLSLGVAIGAGLGVTGLGAANAKAKPGKGDRGGDGDVVVPPSGGKEGRGAHDASNGDGGD